MNGQQLAAKLLAGVVKLAWDALSAIVAGDEKKAGRLAEEAARRQAVRLDADAALKARRK